MNESLTGRKLELYGMVEELVVHTGYEDCLEECREQIRDNLWDEFFNFLELVVMSEKEYLDLVGFVRKYVDRKALR